MERFYSELFNNKYMLKSVKKAVKKYVDEYLPEYYATLLLPAGITISSVVTWSTLFLVFAEFISTKYKPAKQNLQAAAEASTND